MNRDGTKGVAVLLAFLQRITFGGLIFISLGLIGLTLVAAGATIFALRNDAI